MIFAAQLKANASKHKAMGYGRMAEEEKRLRAEVERFLREAQETDAREDALYGPDRRGDELPEQLRTREGRLRKIREAKKALERRKREKGSGKPAAKAQRNFTDPESRIMPSSSEKSLICMGHNLLKLWRSGAIVRPAPA